MKNFFYFIGAVLLCVILAGGVYVATQDTMKKHSNSQVQTSVNEEESFNSTPEEDSSIIEEGFVNGEKRLKSTSDFELNRWYRFYIDRTNPASEAFIVINLITRDGGFNGGYMEVGRDIEVDLPQVKIGISTQFKGQGYIYWTDNMRLSVDAEVDGGENYFDIYLDENVFTGMGDNETIPDIWFELDRETECIAIGEIGGGYVVMLEEK